MSSEKKNIVVYHADCADGFGAAWSAWKKMGDTAEYIPTHYDTDPDPRIFGSNLYLVDFCFSAEVLQAFKDSGTVITLIDHHATNQPKVPLVDHSLFDLTRSGAVLSWSFFHPEEPLPQLLKHIQDSDLWQFELKNTKEIGQALSLYPKDFDTWSTIAEALETEAGVAGYVNEGAVLLKKIQITVNRLVENAEEVTFEGYKALMVNSPVHVSEIGHELAKKQGPLGLIWSRHGKKIIMSLRGDGTVDCSKLAQKYGGGGHPSASAFSWEEEELIRFKERN